MVRSCAVRPVFSVPWLQSGRCGVNDIDGTAVGQLIFSDFWDFIGSLSLFQLS